MSPAKMCTVAYFTVVHCEYETMQRNTQMGFESVGSAKPVRVVKGHVKKIFTAFNYYYFFIILQCNKVAARHQACSSSVQQILADSSHI